MTDGTIERKVSSKSGVKSKVSASAGPKELIGRGCEKFDDMMERRPSNDAGRQWKEESKSTSCGPNPLCRKPLYNFYIPTSLCELQRVRHFLSRLPELNQE